MYGGDIEPWTDRRLRAWKRYESYENGIRKKKGGWVDLLYTFRGQDSPSFIPLEGIILLPATPVSFSIFSFRGAPTDASPSQTARTGLATDRDEIVVEE